MTEHIMRSLEERNEKYQEKENKIIKKNYNKDFIGLSNKWTKRIQLLYYRKKKKGEGGRIEGTELRGEEEEKESKTVDHNPEKLMFKRNYALHI